MTSPSLDDIESSLLRLPIIRKVLERLDRELDPALTYHSLSHTKDVIHESLKFALYDGCNEKELELLAIAAAFHDIGFLIRRSGNEPFGADFAAMAMENSEQYTPAEIKLVSQMILDTGLIQEHDGPHFRPSTPLSGYLLDADVSNFGREDFFDKTQLIVQETNQSLKEIQEFLMALMINHSWHTKAAKVLRDEQKHQNMMLLAAAIKSRA